MFFFNKTPPTTNKINIIIAFQVEDEKEESAQTDTGFHKKNQARKQALRTKQVACKVYQICIFRFFMV